MDDPLLARARLAIEESKAVQKTRRALQAEQLHSRDALRISVMESAMYRTECKAYREDRELMDYSANAKRYRNQAEELRAKGDLMRDPETSAQYSRMADAYDKLADGQDDLAQNMRGKKDGLQS